MPSLARPTTVRPSWTGRTTRRGERGVEYRAISGGWRSKCSRRRRVILLQTRRPGCALAARRAPDGVSNRRAKCPYWTRLTRALAGDILKPTGRAGHARRLRLERLHRPDGARVALATKIRQLHSRALDVDDVNLILAIATDAAGATPNAATATGEAAVVAFEDGVRRVFTKRDKDGCLSLAHARALRECDASGGAQRCDACEK